MAKNYCCSYDPLRRPIFNLKDPCDVEEPKPNGNDGENDDKGKEIKISILVKNSLA